jgi:hypothetical protein
MRDIRQILHKNNIFWLNIKINPNKLRIVKNNKTELYDGEILIYYKLKK